jgi:hypothetical protein
LPGHRERTTARRLAALTTLAEAAVDAERRAGDPPRREVVVHVDAAVHMRHWLFGGRTDLTNLVLLCDRYHGLVHDLDLVMARRDGLLVVTAPDGRRVWGAADAAFAGGLPDPAAPPTDDASVGVHPIDTERGRRPRRRTAAGRDSGHPGAARPHSRTPEMPGRSARRSSRPVSRRCPTECL